MNCILRILILTGILFQPGCLAGIIPDNTFNIWETLKNGKLIDKNTGNLGLAESTAAVNNVYNAQRKHIQNSKNSDEISIKKNNDEYFEPLRMPVQFKSYDYNKDGYIVLRELVAVTGASENAGDAFADSDSDNNGKIDENEFYQAPWDLSGNVERTKRRRQLIS